MKAWKLIAVTVGWAILWPVLFIVVMSILGSIFNGSRCYCPCPPGVTCYCDCHPVSGPLTATLDWLGGTWALVSSGVVLIGGGIVLWMARAKRSAVVVAIGVVVLGIEMAGLHVLAAEFFRPMDSDFETRNGDYRDSSLSESPHTPESPPSLSARPA